MTSKDANALRELSAKQVHSTDDYVTRVRNVIASGNKVILTRTKEPHRVIETLKIHTYASDVEFRHWNCLDGWTRYEDKDKRSTPDEDNRAGVKDSMIDFLAALRVIHDAPPPANNPAINPANYTEVFPDKGLYCMMYPHTWLSEGQNKHPRAVQCIKKYVQEFPYCEQGKTLIMVVPEEFKCPSELEDDVAMIDFTLPSIMERFDVIQHALTEVFGEFFQDDEGAKRFTEFDTWAGVLNASSGLMVKNFQDYFTDALLRQDASNISEINMDDVAAFVASAKTELVKRTDILEVMAGEDMSNVGGQDLLKKWIGNRRNAFTIEARNFGIDAPKGVMLVGPPGSGKSVAAKAISGTLQIPLIRFDVSRVFNSLVGSSEARIRSALKMVDAMEPCVLFIDEIDKVFQSGGGNDSGVSSRVLGTLLTWMQETKSQVFVVMTANRTAGLPPELLRKGRLDEIFSVTTPSVEEREEVARIHLTKRGHNPDEDGIDLKEIAKASDGYVPSEIECAIKEALLDAFNEDKPVTAEAIIAEIQAMTPLSVSFAHDFAEMEEWAKNNARPSSSKQHTPAAVSALKEFVPTSSRRRSIGKKGAKSEDDTLDISSDD